MEVNLCIPTLNRYDKLTFLLQSLTSSTVKPNIFIIDNGGMIRERISPKLLDGVNIYSKGYNLGVAASWNWLISLTKDIRIISNDDIRFGTTAIEEFVKHFKDDALVYPDVSHVNLFSCFILPDFIVNEVGYFDEAISPGYGYFEDNDYSHRLSKKNYGVVCVDTIKVTHDVSSTKGLFDEIEMKEHHKKFKLAKENYVKKWGGVPGQETK